MENIKIGQVLAAEWYNLEEEEWNELLKLVEGSG